MSQHRDHETELWLAIDEGLLKRDEADALREEARRLGRGPLELLRERGRLSEETFASLMKKPGAEPAVPAPEAAAPEVPSAGQAAPAHAPAPADQTLTMSPGKAAPANVPSPADQTLTMNPGAPPRSSPALPQSPSQPAFPIPNWDRYQAVGFLGQGGMGRVFAAYDPRLRRQVAIKFVRDDDPELTRRFISEARAQAKVNHERVCKVYEVGNVDGKVFIAMQYIDGKPLSALARSLSVEQKAVALREAAIGVHEAHRVGLIHRDIKPSNIMVERDEDGSLRPYVMDFGLARDWDESTTATGTVLGTPHYMSPEQARGEVARLDRRADVYSLGASLYALLTGHPPIPGENGLEILSNITTVEPRPPRALDADIPADLEAITLKCLEKERSARYDSARAFAEDLDRFLAGEPVLARTGLTYRLRKRLRKHRILASVSGAALLAVLAAVGWGAVARRDASERERLARRFTEQVERVESLARYSALARLHDTREERKAIQARMAELQAEIDRGGDRALGPGHYALGRGHLALGDTEQAHRHLTSAWEHGFREPRAAYALALVTGQLYQQQYLEAQRVRDATVREARLREAEQRYRDPALAYLRQSQGAEVPSREYVAALLAFYEGRLDDALRELDAIGGTLSWFYEAPILRGEILESRAVKRWNSGDLEGARADLEASRKAFAAAAATAESEPSLYRAGLRLENDAMLVELYGRGDVLPPYGRAAETLSRCLAASPEDYACLSWMARVHHRLAEHRLNQGGDVPGPAGQALATAERARAVDPARPEAVLNLARSTWLLARYRSDRGEDPRGLFQQAAALFESIRAGDRDASYHVDYGLLFKTWADYEDQLGADPRENHGKAIAAYRAALALDDRVPGTWINLGNALLARAGVVGNADADAELEQAAAAYEKARTLNPKHVVPYFYAGQVREKLALRKHARGADPRPDLETALSWYQQGIAINPKLPHLHNGTGVALMRKADDAWDRGEDPLPLLAEAQAPLERAMAAAPGQGFAYLNLGTLNTMRGRFLLKRGGDPRPHLRAAEALFRQGLERMPGATAPRIMLASVHVLSAEHALGQGRDPSPDLARATEELRVSREKNEKDPDLWLQSGLAHALQTRWRERHGQARAEDYEDAAKSLGRAVELSPDDPAYALELARFWLGGSNQVGTEPGPLLQRGLEQVEQALKHRPGWPEARALRAGLRLALAEALSPEQRHAARQGALEELSQALESNPNLAHAWEGRLTQARRLSAGP